MRLTSNLNFAALLPSLDDAATDERFFAFEDVGSKVRAEVWHVRLLNVVAASAAEPVLIAHPVHLRRDGETAVQDAGFSDLAQVGGAEFPHLSGD